MDYSVIGSLADHDYSEAILDEAGRMQAYINVLKGAALVGRNAYQLNSEEVGNLMELVDEGHYDRPSGWASNLLCAVYKVCRPPATGAVELPKANRRRERERPANTAAEASFGAYPNPARTWVAFAYDRKDGEVNGSIVIRDLAGRTITTLMMNGQRGQQIRDPREVAPGTIGAVHERKRSAAHRAHHLTTMRALLWMLVALCAASIQSSTAYGQWNFQLDTTFRTIITSSTVNSLAVMPSGHLLLSGRMNFQGAPGERALAKVDMNGVRDPSFPFGYGGGKLTPWADRYYVDNGLVRRFLPSGLLDPSFMSQIYSPYVGSNVTLGDYHVFPDGRLLISGSYMLSDSVRGFVGQYRLVWFSNQGYLDTTRIHRRANGVIWDFAELPDGKFLCSCTCTQYEGQPVDRLFRIHADGALDTTFHSGVNWGNIFAYHGLPDGRVYVGGRYKRAVAPNDTLYLARFMPDGSLDPTFNHANNLGLKGF
ncbi:MAG: delta-60 repeat domain-containing protein [Flavobacteriales bacterium]|nr:delta-60 repeat domain-containing protein [Flavobacteriales bacterium]